MLGVADALLPSAGLRAVLAEELAWYRSMMQPYGPPLDSRKVLGG